SILNRNAQKDIVGGYESLDGGGSSCTVDCTGCAAYKCDSGCDASQNNVSVTCNGVKKTCNAYPTCWT
ncbi:hypothetical protein ACSTI0_00580, partial [Vibrio parahaemolyticus]